MMSKGIGCFLIAIILLLVYIPQIADARNGHDIDLLEPITKVDIDDMLNSQTTQSDDYWGGDPWGAITRDEIDDIASEMIDTAWSPQSTFTLWNRTFFINPYYPFP